MWDILQTPPATDVLWQWVNLILPDTMDSAYAHALATFTAVLAALASLMVAFHVVVGIVASAYSGQVLGGRFHQIWAPMRVVLGFAMLVPIAGGFSSVHHGFKHIIAPLAINLGNAHIRTYVHEVAGEDRKPITPYRTGGDRLAVDILENEICLAIDNEVRSSWLPKRQAPSPTGEESGWGIVGNPVFKWDYGPKCGSFSFEKVAGRETFSNSRMLAVGRMVSELRKLAPTYGEYFRKHNVELTAEQAEEALRNSALPQLLQKLHDLGADFDSSVIKAAHNETKDLARDASNKMIEAIDKEGLMRGGDTYLAIAQTSYLSTSLTNEMPTRTPPRIEDLAKNEEIKSAIRAGIDTLKNQVAAETL
jgi:conjugal transfer/type IV secretion protein DotA/TraY